MKYALKYFSTSKKMAEADEIIIGYYEIAPLDHLIWFATEKCKPEQRLVINFDMATILVNYKDKNGVDAFESQQEYILEEAKKFVALKEYHSNIAIKLETTFGKSVDSFIKILKDNDVPFFFGRSPKNIAEVNALIEYGVSDIYITE